MNSHAGYAKRIRKRAEQDRIKSIQGRCITKDRAFQDSTKSLGRISKKKNFIRDYINKRPHLCPKDLWDQRNNNKKKTRAYLLRYNVDGWRRRSKEAEMKLENYFMSKNNKYHAGFEVSKQRPIEGGSVIYEQNTEY